MNGSGRDTPNVLYLTVGSLVPTYLARRYVRLYCPWYVPQTSVIVYRYALINRITGSHNESRTR